MARRERVTRGEVVDEIIAALEPLDEARALWEQGAASFNRVDRYSDIDLCVIAEDEGVEKVFSAAERALAKRFGITSKFRLPEPTWHGHSQCFYWLDGASPYLFVDLAVEKRSAKNRFLEYAIHGPPVVRIDKDGLVGDDSPSPREFASKLAARLETLRTTFRLFQVEVKKELARGNDLEALAFYNSMTLRPLVEALRIRHCPWRHDFHTRYAYYDLPAPVVKRLHGFFFVRDAKEIERRRDEAERWFWETVDGLGKKEIERALAR